VVAFTLGLLCSTVTDRPGAKALQLLVRKEAGLCTAEPARLSVWRRCRTALASGPRLRACVTGSVFFETNEAVFRAVRQTHNRADVYQAFISEISGAGSTTIGRVVLAGFSLNP
jgi:hypothetical protein